MHIAKRKGLLDVEDTAEAEAVQFCLSILLHSTAHASIMLI